MSYLIDTSVVTRLSRPEVGQRLRTLDAAGLARSAMTDLEVGYSASNGAECDRLRGALDAFGLVEIEPPHFDRARQTQRLLAEAGLTGRKVPDLLIAAAAEAESLTVLHYDRDFDHIHTVTGQPTEWIVEQGSID